MTSISMGDSSGFCIYKDYFWTIYIPSPSINIDKRYLTKKNLNYWFDLKNFCSIYYCYNKLQTAKKYSKWLPIA
jgi:hypothetical protein